MTSADDRIVWEADEDALYLTAREARQVEEALEGHAPAQNRTLSDAQPENGSTVPDAATGDPARRDRRDFDTIAGACIRYVNAYRDPHADATILGSQIASLRAALSVVHEREVAGLRAEVERLEGNLSALLCDLTNGRLSKTTYDVRTMVREIEACFQETPTPETSGAGSSDAAPEGLALPEIVRCDSCNAAELVLRYSPTHGATFCIPCYERENADAAPEAPDHWLNEHGTTDCPVEKVRAMADDDGDGVLICSACGCVVAPSDAAPESGEGR